VDPGVYANSTLGDLDGSALSVAPPLPTLIRQVALATSPGDVKRVS
jgi:hypothetical protein